MAAGASPYILDCWAFRDRLYPLFTRAVPDPYREQEVFLRDAILRGGALPRVLREFTDGFRVQGNREGVLLLKNLPVDPDLPPTPCDDRAGCKTTRVSETCLAVFGSRLGELFGYLQIDNGALFSDVIARQSMEFRKNYQGSRVPLALHTEQHFHPHSPDYLLLYCLCGAQHAVTCFAGVREITGRLAPARRDMLFEPVFRCGIDDVFGNRANEKGTGALLPVLYGDRSDPFLRYDRDLMVGTTPEAVEALEALQEALEAVQHSVCLGAGDLLVIDNRRAVHGRSAFLPRFDGQGRWLQRVKVLACLEDSTGERAPGSRVICTPPAGWTTGSAAH